MGLSLVVGPAHAGKVALLLERYVDVLERDPWLVVPNRVDVDRVERDLIRRSPALLAGTVGTFDDLFRHVAEGGGDGPVVASDAQRVLALRRVVASAALDDLDELRGRGGVRGHLAPGDRRDRIRPRRPRPVERRPPTARPCVSERARAPRPPRSRRAATPCRRTAPERARRLVGCAGLRLRVRGPDRGRVGAARGTRGAHGGDGLGAVRAGESCLRRAGADGGGSRGPRRRRDRGARTPGVRRPAAGAPPRGARAVLGRRGHGPVARRRGPLSRGCRDAGYRRAPRKRDCVTPARWDGAGARRRRLRVRRSLASASRGGVRATCGFRTRSSTDEASETRRSAGR